MLEIRGLTKRYGPVTALDGASFTAARGRLVGFLGPNGAGKTTTMRCVFGLATPDAGDVRWDAQPIDDDMRLRFGYMPEQRGLYPRMRVAEQLSYFGQHHGLSSKDAKARGIAWLERFGLADRAKSKLEDLSHGNQQRVQLATALVHDPELLVLDEPFSGLDPIGIATMTEVLRERAAAGRRRGVQLAPAGPRRGRVPGRRDHQPGSRRGRGRDRRAQDGVRAPAPRGGGRGHRRRLARRDEQPRGARARRRPRQAARGRGGRPGLAARGGPRPPARCGASATSRRGCRSCSWRR